MPKEVCFFYLLCTVPLLTLGVPMLGRYLTRVMWLKSRTFVTAGLPWGLFLRLYQFANEAI
jgi:hypothetical protein